jgi:membrane protease subunit HflC
MVADATAKGEQIRGEGDADRNRIFAEAFGRDQDFFTFYRTMQAYEASIHKNDTRMLLKPDSDFFRYFNDPLGRLREAGGGSEASRAGAPQSAPPQAPPAPATPAAPQ